MEWVYGEKAFRVVPLEELLEYYEKDWAGKLIGIGIFTLGVNNKLDKRVSRRYYNYVHPWGE